MSNKPTVPTRPYEVRYNQLFGQYMLHISAGIDPKDGQPLTAATPLLPHEAVMWQCGDRVELERSLRARGIPLPSVFAARKGKWRRFVEALRKKLTGK